MYPLPCQVRDCTDGGVLGFHCSSAVGRARQQDEFAGPCRTSGGATAVTRSHERIVSQEARRDHRGLTRVSFLVWALCVVGIEAVTASAFELELAQLEQMCEETLHGRDMQMMPHSVEPPRGSETGFVARKGRRSTRTFPLAWVRPKANRLKAHPCRCAPASNGGLWTGSRTFFNRRTVVCKGLCDVFMWARVNEERTYLKEKR